jgi:hypothetical protein
MRKWIELQGLIIIFQSVENNEMIMATGIKHLERPSRPPGWKRGAGGPSFDVKGHIFRCKRCGFTCEIECERRNTAVNAKKSQNIFSARKRRHKN